MGQQQLILLALAVVIVGGAIVVGIRAFNENSVKNNADTMTQDAIRIANDMQAWKQKPAPFGGQASLTTGASPSVTQVQLNTPGDFTGADFALLGYAATGTGATKTYFNLNGEFRIVAPGTATQVIGINRQFINQVTVNVTGLSDTDITGQIDCLNNVTVSTGASGCTLAW